MICRWLFPVVASVSLAFPSCRTVGDEDVVGAFDEAAFVSADSDADGRLTSHELALHKHREALAEFDLDNDNRISQSEWAAAYPDAASRDEHFNRLDKNGDGHVSEDEGALFITEHIDYSDRFKKLDSNNDFYLHWEEIDEASPSELNITLFSLHPDTR